MTSRERMIQALCVAGPLAVLAFFLARLAGII